MVICKKQAVWSLACIFVEVKRGDVENCLRGLPAEDK